MKRVVWKKAIALAMAAVMVATVVPRMLTMKAYAAESVNTETQQKLLKGVFDKLVVNTKYQELKGLYGESATLTENYEVKEDKSAVISFTIKANEGYEEWISTSEATFYIDKDNFIYCTMEMNNPKTMLTALMMDYVCAAIADYYGMDAQSVSRYLTAVPSTVENSKNFETKYYVVKPNDAEETSLTLKFYAGAKWDEAEIQKVLDEAYFTEKYVQNSNSFETLTSETSYSVDNLGKFAVVRDGNKNNFTLTLAEYGKYDEKGVLSIKNIINAVKPEGYEQFDYTGGVDEKKGSLWSVKKPEGEEIPEAMRELEGKCEFVQVRFTTPYISFGIDHALAAGEFWNLFVENGTVKKWTSSNSKVASVTKDGQVTALKKGTATITATLKDGTKLTQKITVKSSPSIKVAGKKFVSTKTYTVKRGKTLKVSIKGKAFLVNNKYASTKSKVAKVISKKDVSIIKIKGYKKGTAKVTVTVNGVSFKIKVKVV